MQDCDSFPFQDTVLIFSLSHSTINWLYFGTRRIPRNSKCNYQNNENQEQNTDNSIIEIPESIGLFFGDCSSRERSRCWLSFPSYKSGRGSLTISLKSVEEFVPLSMVRGILPSEDRVSTGMEWIAGSKRAEESIVIIHDKWIDKSAFQIGINVLLRIECQVPKNKPHFRWWCNRAFWGNCLTSLDF